MMSAREDVHSKLYGTLVLLNFDCSSSPQVLGFGPLLLSGISSLEGFSSFSSCSFQVQAVEETRGLPFGPNTLGMFSVTQ